MIKYEDNLAARINGNNLQPLAGAEVRVTDKATNLPAALFQDNELTPIPQPLTTDNNGYFAFKAADGKYTLTFSATQNSPRFDTFTREIVLEDPADNPFLTAQELALQNGVSKIGFGLRTLADKLAETVSVKDAPYNAAGDGVTDDTAAIQAAIDANVTVFFPAGTYKHGALKLKKQGQTLRGAGKDTTILLCTSGYAISNFTGSEAAAIGEDWVGGLVLENLWLRGGFTHTDDFSSPANSWAHASGRSKTLTTTDINAGLRLKRCYPYTLRGVRISNFNRGVYASGAALARWDDWEISDCEAGLYGENGSVWGDSAWQITTHRLVNGRFKNCWLGITGRDFVQCRIPDTSVDFEPCNTGVYVINGGDNVWGGYYELCHEGIVRDGGDMGVDIIEDPFFGGSPGAYWGYGYSIHMLPTVGATGSLVLRNGGKTVTGGGISIQGGRLVHAERERFVTTVFLSPTQAPAGGYVETNLTFAEVSAVDDVVGLFDPAQPSRLTIPASLNGARVKLKANFTVQGDATPNDMLVEFRKNGASFPGTGRYSGLVAQTYSVGLESAAVTVATGDYFTLTILMNPSRNIPTGNQAWLSLEVVA